jgi:membrane-associated phospholipid phosphatase
MMQKFFNNRLNLLTYGSVFALLVFFVVLAATHSGFSAGLGWSATRYYFDAIEESFIYVAIIVVDFAAIFLAFLATLSLLGNFVDLFRGRRMKPTMLGGESLLASLTNGARTLWRTVIAVAPAIVFIIIMSFILDGINAIDRARLVDLAVVGWERSLIGGYGFVIFGSIHYPIWLARFVIGSFSAMSGLLLVAVFVVAYLRKEALREFVAAFCLCMAMMVPLWFAVPALSPQDRFMDDIYRLPETADIAAAVAGYHPVAPIADFLAGVRKEKNGLANLPTSTFPSAHAAWAVFAGYYLFRARKWLGWIALPFLIASTAGTVMLAQHYLLDPIFGILIAAFAIFVVEQLSRRDMADAQLKAL